MNCPLCSIDLESHNKYFLNLLKTSKTLISNIKEFEGDFEKINFSNPFDQTFESCFISGIYWTLSSLIILNPGIKLIDIINYDELNDIFNAVVSCSQNIGTHSLGFAPFYKKFYYSPTVLHTLHAIQILVILSKDLLHVNNWITSHDTMLVNFLKSQILSNGSVSRAMYSLNLHSNTSLSGDIRDIASLFGCVYLLQKLTGKDYSSEFDNVLSFEWITSCKNDDGGYGLRPKAESHIGACFCVSAISNLKMIGDLNVNDNSLFDAMEMNKWLVSRQSINGGISGHGDKNPDVCYSYWLLATQSLISNKLNGNFDIDLDKLIQFIQSCANPTGGFSKYPFETTIGYFSLLFDRDNSPDPYHSFKSLAALLLAGMHLSSLCSKHKSTLIDPLTALVLY